MKNATFLALCALLASTFLLVGCNRHLGPEGPDGHDRHYMEPSTPDRQEGLLDPSHIASEFPNKIVYTTERNVDVQALRDDCRIRGGSFNECGSPCMEGQICAQVCAYTCEFR